MNRDINPHIAIHPRERHFDQRRFYIYATLFLVFVVGLTIRLSHLNQSRLIAEVQFRTALRARGYYFNLSEGIPEWRREISAESINNLPEKELPILPYIVGGIYAILDSEQIWIAQPVSITFWMVASLFIFLTVKKWISLDGAVFATTYFLLIPKGVHVSISLISDNLMIMLFTLSVYTMLRYSEKPTLRRLVLSAAISGLAIFIKALILLPIILGYLSLYRVMHKSRRALFQRDLWIFLGLSLAIGLIYGTLFKDYTLLQIQQSYLPHLPFQPGYWKDWLLVAVSGVGLVPLILALLSFPLIENARYRSLLIGLSLGYALNGLIFTHHYRFAAYYHIQLAVVVALAMGVPIALLSRRLRENIRGWFGWVPVIAAISLLTIFAIKEIRAEIFSYADYDSPSVAQEIGEIVHHSQRVVHISPYYGRPLEYFAELTGAYWPRADEWSKYGFMDEPLSMQERFDRLDFTPEYYVITDMQEYESYHADLRSYLEGNCQVLAQNGHYLIYHSCQNP